MRGKVEKSQWINVWATDRPPSEGGGHPILLANSKLRRPATCRKHVAGAPPDMHYQGSLSRRGTTLAFLPPPGRRSDLTFRADYPAPMLARHPDDAQTGSKWSGPMDGVQVHAQGQANVQAEVPAPGQVPAHDGEPPAQFEAHFQVQDHAQVLEVEGHAPARIRNAGQGLRTRLRSGPCPSP